MSSLGNYIKKFFESSSNISLKTQSDLQCIIIVITEETRNEVLKNYEVKENLWAIEIIIPSKLQMFQRKRKRKYDENRNQVLKLRKQHYKDNANNIKNKEESLLFWKCKVN